MRFFGLGQDEHRPTVAEQAFHLDLVPVAGVGQHDVGLLLDACAAELMLGRATAPT